MMMRAGIAGISGRMGTLLADEVRAAGMVLVGGTSRKPALASDVAHFVDVTALAAACDVLIDFTNAGTVIGHAQAVAAGGCAWVLGTSGLSAADEAAVVVAAQKIAVVYAPNFSPGVNLAIALAERMAAALQRMSTMPKSLKCIIARKSMRHLARRSGWGGRWRAGAA